MHKRIMIAGTGSGVGKTTVTIGLMAALKQNDYIVQGFKCGPDYIDPSYHTSITGRISRNLDSWMCSHEAVKEIFVHGCEGADISIIEGMMGFYDGRDSFSNAGSTAEISEILDCPVILVVDCKNMARSAAAIVNGYQTFSDRSNIAGVIVNRVGSEGHYHIIKKAIEVECQIPVVGYLLSDEQLEIPERHLGLVPSIERGELAGFFQRLADSIQTTIEIEQLLRIAEIESIKINKPILFSSSAAVDKKQGVKIAVARDESFHFYYPENLELLEELGAECVYFSPVRGETVPVGVHGLYLGGGFPEEYAKSLARNDLTKDSIKRTIEAGLPTLAECGGFMYLCDELVTTDNQLYPMLGIIPGRIKMHKRLQALGYREIQANGQTFLMSSADVAKGHEFHYSSFQPTEHVTPAYLVQSLHGKAPEGYTKGNLVAGYTHFHFASNLNLPRRWIQACKEVL